MSLAPTSRTQADSPPSSPVLGPTRGGQLDPFVPSPRTPAQDHRHPTLSIRIAHLCDKTAELQQRKDLLDEGHGLEQHRTAVWIAAIRLATSITAVHAEVRGSEESLMGPAQTKATTGKNIPVSKNKLASSSQTVQPRAVSPDHGGGQWTTVEPNRPPRVNGHVLAPLATTKKVISATDPTLFKIEDMFKKLAVPLLGEVLLRQLSAHKELIAGSQVLSGQGEETVPDTNLRTCFPVLAPVKRLDPNDVLREKVKAARLDPAVSDSLNEMIRNSSARNGAAHPACDGVKNNWFLRIAQVLDLINYGPHKPGEAVPAGWVCASNRFVGSEYGKQAMNKAAAVREQRGSQV